MSSVLSHDDILRIHGAAVSFGLAGSRDALLAGIPPSIVTSISVAATSSSQLLVDLSTLNDFGQLPDGVIPLRIWLSNATSLCGPWPGVEAFRHALRQLAVARVRMDPGSGRPWTLHQESIGEVADSAWTNEVSELEILALDTNHVFAKWTNVLIIIWARDTLLSAVKHIHAESRRVTSKGACYGVLVITTEDARPPTPKVAGAIVQVNRDPSIPVCCGVLCMESKEFLGATVISVASSIISATTARYKLVQNAYDGARWLCRAVFDACRTPIDSTQLLIAVQASRARLAQQQRRNRSRINSA